MQAQVPSWVRGRRRAQSTGGSLRKKKGTKERNRGPKEQVEERRGKQS